VPFSRSRSDGEPGGDLPQVCCVTGADGRRPKDGGEAVLRVGLTGGIGSGKSEVARRLVARGAVLIDADVAAREVVVPGSRGLSQIVAAFGDDVLSPDGSLDRARLGEIVFGDPELRAKLNAIVRGRTYRGAGGRSQCRKNTGPDRRA